MQPCSGERVDVLGSRGRIDLRMNARREFLEEPAAPQEGIDDVRPTDSGARDGSRWRLWLAVTAVMLTCLAAAASMQSERGAPAPAAPATNRPAPAPANPGVASRYAFAPNTVVEMARRLAANSFSPRKIDNGSPLHQLSYDQHRDIRFNAEAGIWRNEQVPFRLEVLPAGFIYQLPVSVAVVENRTARDLASLPGMFTLGPLASKPLGNHSIPFSGFRLRTHINSRSVWDEFLVFQGASYFRAVPRGGSYGLSARGLALRTAHPAGEEFPAFTNFWVERPPANASGIVVHALLDSPSTTGAYRFSVTPGIETVMDVDVTLFPRVPLDNVGLAPLTSMFLFDESNRSRIDDFRDEVHDSDGLQVVLASGERVWRPLANPTQLQVSSFTTEAPRAFGLIQRSRKAANYHDLEANYETRPSAWIEPTSQWGAGSVQLVEIPTDNETNDNIVTFWRPKDPIPAGKPWHASYRMRWTSTPKMMPPLGRVTRTRTGPSFDGKRRIFVVEFIGAGRSPDGMRIEAGTSAGKLSNMVLQANPITKGLRASFELDPSDTNVAELRVRLVKGDRPATETWLYRWTAS
jgi:periplasmic glucans biosynthesis protein